MLKSSSCLWASTYKLGLINTSANTFSVTTNTPKYLPLDFTYCLKIFFLLKLGNSFVLRRCVNTRFFLSLCVLLIASGVTRKRWYRPQLEKNDRWPQLRRLHRLENYSFYRHISDIGNPIFLKMSLDRAHTSIKQTARVTVTGIQRQRLQQWPTKLR